MVEDKHSTIGVVALRYTSSTPEVLLLLKRKYHVYGFAKGHREEGETDIQTACRELMEESGCRPDHFLGENQWTTDLSHAKFLPSFHRTKVKLNGKEKAKVTVYYVATATQVAPIHDTEEIEDAQWFPLTAETANALQGRPEFDFFMQEILPLANLPRPSDGSSQFLES